MRGWWLVNNGKWLGALTGAALGALCSWWSGGGVLFQDLLMALMGLFCLDTVLGLVVSMALRREPFSSRKFRRVYMKMLQYVGLILLTYNFDVLFGHTTGQHGHFYVVEMAACLSVVVHEAASVLEHLKAMEGVTGFKVPDFIGSKIEEMEHLPDILSHHHDKGPKT